METAINKYRVCIHWVWPEFARNFNFILFFESHKYFSFGSALNCFLFARQYLNRRMNFSNFRISKNVEFFQFSNCLCKLMDWDRVDFISFWQKRWFADKLIGIFSESKKDSKFHQSRRFLFIFFRACQEVDDLSLFTLFWLAMTKWSISSNLHIFLPEKIPIWTFQTQNDVHSQFLIVLTT